jgi:hypothetical protein
MRREPAIHGFFCDPHRWARMADQVRYDREVEINAVSEESSRNGFPQKPLRGEFLEIELFLDSM